MKVYSTLLFVVLVLASVPKASAQTTDSDFFSFLTNFFRDLFRAFNCLFGGSTCSSNGLPGAPGPINSVNAPTVAPARPPTQAPVRPPTKAPMKPPTQAPVRPPTKAPVRPPTKAPVRPPTKAPVKPPTQAPTSSKGVWVLTDAPTISARHEACFLMVGSKAYLVGGRGFKPVDIFDPVTKTWTKGAQPPKDIHHIQCVAARGKLWVMAAWTGGYPQENNAEYVYVYDPATDKWSTKTALPANRRRGGAAVVVSKDESKIYVSHGNNGGHEQNNFAVSLGYLDVYDIDTDTWTALPDAPNPRDHTCGAIINGRICVAGGRNGGEVGWPAVGATDCYDIATRTWTVEAAIPNNRAGVACGTTCDGKLMVAGGEEQWKAQEFTSVFDGKTWTNLAPLVDSRHGTGLAVDCTANLIYMASGSGEGGGGPELLTMETFFPNGIPR